MAKINDPSSEYCHGPYIVLSDGSTYERADDASIALITQDGEDHLNDAMDFEAVFADDVFFIDLGDLIDAYNQVHGTNL